MESTLTLAIIGLALTQFGSVIGIVWYISGRLTRIETNGTNNGAAVDKVDHKLDDHIEQFDKHIVDQSVHTTLEQRKDINRRIDTLDQTVKEGYKDLGQKIDRWAEIMLKK